MKKKRDLNYRFKKVQRWVNFFKFVLSTATILLCGYTIKFFLVDKHRASLLTACIPILFLAVGVILIIHFKNVYRENESRAYLQKRVKYF